MKRRGVTTICAWCKRIRLPNGSWVSSEVMGRQEERGLLSHGYCSECMESLMAKENSSSLREDKLDHLSRKLIDTIPAVVLVVDQSLRVQEYNRAAAQHIESSRSAILQRRIGSVLDCVNEKEAPDGCSSSPKCEECLLRLAVEKAFQSWTTRLSPACIEIIRNGQRTEVPTEVTASPFRLGERNLVLLIIEGIS